MQTAAVSYLLVTACLLGSLVWRFASPEVSHIEALNRQLQLQGLRFAQLQAEYAQLTAKYSTQVEHVKAAADAAQIAEAAAAAAEVKYAAARASSQPGGNSSEIEAQLSLHKRWDWRSIASDALRQWPSIELSQIEAGVAACHNSSMYCSRMQVHKGKLYLTDYRAIFFDRHYAPARVLPLLETLRRHPHLPDMDLVVAANDEPRIPSQPGDRRSWSKSCRLWPGGLSGGQMPPALFSSTVNSAHMDLPWIDFAWFFPTRPHKLRTPRWRELHGTLLKAGRAVAWANKVELAMHTGNVGSGPRKRLAKEADANPGEILVNELFIGDHRKIRQTCRELGLHRHGGYQQHKCFMPSADQCAYKYLLNSASIGYANKFKSLLLCGSVVLYVRDGMHHKEFYELGLLPGVHYVVVESAAEVPAMVRWLREHDEYAHAVARAGQTRMAALDEGGLTDFLAELLTQYAKRLAYRPTPQAGAVQIECEDDLWRHYALTRDWANAYLTLDNSSCVRPPKPGEPLGPPGWGGAYRGSKPRCTASHDLAPKAQPHACDFLKPFATAESWEPWGSFPKAHPRNRERWDTD